jgi:hypothetical protein
MKADDFDVKARAFPFEDSDHPFITVTDKGVTFNMQRGPIREVGVNGCQIDDIVKLVTETVRVLNAKFPCRENSIAITKLEEAMLWFEARRLDRVARDVEGLNRA